MVAVEALDRRAAQVHQDSNLRTLQEDNHSVQETFVPEEVSQKFLALADERIFITKSELIAYYKNQWEAMVGYCERIGSSDPENAAQNGFMNAYDAISTFKRANPNSMKSWIYKITSNVVIDELRSRHRENTKLGERIPSESYEVFNVLDHQEQPMDVAVSNDSVDELLEMLRVLPGRQSYAILLYAQGYTYKEIGELLGTTMASVKQLIFRGRREMQELRSSEPTIRVTENANDGV